MTATPPRADLRTLAAEAIRHGDHALADDGECGRREDQLAVVDAVLAAVLPEHRRMVLAEAAEALSIDAGRLRVALDAGIQFASAGRVVGLQDAANLIRQLAAAAPPAGLSATVPAENAPAVPEEADGQRAAEGGFRLKRRTDAERADYLTQKLIEIMAERDRLREAWETCPHVPAAEVEEVRADRDRLAAQVERVRALHIPELFAGIRACLACSPGMPPPTLIEWPCPTITAVDALPDAGTDQTEGRP